MPSGSYRQVDVKCPYYQFDDGKRRITCEGLLPDSNIANIFRSKRDFDTQMNLFCCQGYRKCEAFIALEQKYKEDQ